VPLPPDPPGLESTVLTQVRRLLREPLLHFLVLGGLLFLWSGWRGGLGPGSSRIVVTRGHIEHLAAGFARTWQRPPTEAELKVLVDDYIKEEIATREAAALGLDRDDTVVRRRLRQKLEFLAEDAPDPPTDAQLAEWLDRHRAAYQAEPRVALRQVYLSVERRGPAARADAERLLTRLRTAGPQAAHAAIGDASMLPPDLPPGPLSDVARTFGTGFAQAIEALPVGQWSGPVASSYGLHLVLVTERAVSPAPSLAEVRSLLERDFLAERRQAQLQALYDRLLQRYTVTIETPRTGREGAAAGAGGQ
jgi:parvulin-like peptidyl-prolyl cis-trans isomerase-like protein